MNYAFKLRYQGSRPDKKITRTLFEAGCDDALVAVVNGTLFLDFHRDGPSFEDAVKSASRDVELAGGRVIRAIPTPE
jgi:hypothetical protein